MTNAPFAAEAHAQSGPHAPGAAYRPDIDGLRAVAVSAVVIFHAFPRLLTGGFVGVDVFFVISGFLITQIVSGQVEAGRFSFADFYERRIRRLLPALAAVIVVTALIALFVLPPGDLKSFARSIGPCRHAGTDKERPRVRRYRHRLDQNRAHVL